MHETKIFASKITGQFASAQGGQFGRRLQGELSVVGKDAATGKYESIKNLQYGFKLRRDGTVKAIKLRDRSVSKFQKQSIKSAK